MTEYLCPVLATSYPFTGGVISSFLTRNVRQRSLKQPSFKLSDRVARVSKSTSLACMGYGSSLVYREFGGITGNGFTPLALYGTTLLLDWSQTPLFVKTQSTTLGAVSMSVVLGTAIATFISFYKVDTKAGYCLLPYLFWTFYKTCLHVSLMRNNSNNEE